MEQLTVEVYCRRAALELIALIAHQRRPHGRRRHGSPLLRRCIKEVLANVPVDERPGGPWTVGRRALERRGRDGLNFIPLVRRGQTAIMMATLEEAEELAAFLNYCGMAEFSASSAERPK